MPQLAYIECVLFASHCTGLFMSCESEGHPPLNFADLLKELTRLKSRLYPRLRIIRAKIYSPRATGKRPLSGGSQRGWTHAFEYLPIWGHLGHAIFLATNQRDMCKMSLPREASASEAFIESWSHRYTMLHDQPWQVKLRIPTMKPDAHRQC